MVASCLRIVRQHSRAAFGARARTWPTRAAACACRAHELRAHTHTRVPALASHIASFSFRAGAS
eukprot:9011823-Alexandrium_andersonii.AAC.1